MAGFRVISRKPISGVPLNKYQTSCVDSSQTFSLLKQDDQQVIVRIPDDCDCGDDLRKWIIIKLSLNFQMAKFFPIWFDRHHLQFLMRTAWVFRAGT